MKGKSTPIIANFPTLQEFAVKIGVTVSTLRRWAEENEEFAEVCEMSKDIQEAAIINVGLSGVSSGFAASYTKCRLGWREEEQVVEDRTEVTLQCGVPIELDEYGNPLINGELLEDSYGKIYEEDRKNNYKNEEDN